MMYVVLGSSSTIIACVTLTAWKTATQGEVFVVNIFFIIITNLPISADQYAVRHV